MKFLSLGKRNFGWIIGGLLVLAALIYGFLPAPIPVDLGTVEPGVLRVAIEEDGHCRLKERFVISAPLPGQLQRIRWDPGDRLKANDAILAVIEPLDPSLLDARARRQCEMRIQAAAAGVEQARANLERQQTAFSYAKSDLERARLLQSQGGISDQEYDQAEQKERLSAEALKSAEYALKVAEFEVEIAQAALCRFDPTNQPTSDEWRLEIRSPIDGQVLRVWQESAGMVNAGTPLMEIGDTSQLELVIDVLSQDAVKITPGAAVWIQHWGGPSPLSARVRSVEPAAFTKLSALGVEEQRVWVIADFVDPIEKRTALGDGYRIEASIIVWENDHVVKAPMGALFRHNTNWAVFVFQDGKARLRSIQIGQQNGSEAEIQSGLSVGESIILYPSDLIKDNVTVVSR